MLMGLSAAGVTQPTHKRNNRRGWKLCYTAHCEQRLQNRQGPSRCNPSNAFRRQGFASGAGNSPLRTQIPPNDNRNEKTIARLQGPVYDPGSRATFHGECGNSGRRFDDDSIQARAWCAGRGNDVR
jgi:hypothetical protein